MQIAHYFVKVVIVQYTYNMDGKTLNYYKLIQKKKKEKNQLLWRKESLQFKKILFIVYNIHFISVFF